MKLASFLKTIRVVIRPRPSLGVTGGIFNFGMHPGPVHVVCPGAAASSPPPRPGSSFSAFQLFRFSAFAP
jgi:hypothetical protein